MDSDRTFSWALLPVETRLSILEELADPRGHSGAETRVEAGQLQPITSLLSRRHIARYAMVCKEWQSCFEKALFGKLILNQHDFGALSRLVPRQVALIRHVWLRVELCRYDCPDCDSGSELGRVINANTVVTGEAVYDLFCVLGAWEGVLRQDLTLELSAHSPSDSEHHFKDFDFNDDDPGEQALGRREIIAPDDPFHGWAGGQRMPMARSITRKRVDKIFAFPVSAFVELPIVRSVTRLLLRRQTRRAWSPVTLENLFKSLPRLETIWFEWWRERWSGGQISRDEGLTRNMVMWAPETVKHIVLFEDFNADIDSLYLAPRREMGIQLLRSPHQPLGHSLARDFKGLRSLSVSFVADAQDFFDAVCQEPAQHGTWPDLASVSLTSPALRYPSETRETSFPRANEEDTKRLLLTAAHGALRMPALQTLELWYGRTDQACLFRYKSMPDATTEIVCSGTWSLALPPDIVTAWELVSLRRNGIGHRQRIVSRIFPADLVKSHADAIHHLGLEIEVVDKVSLVQMRREAQYPWQHLEDPEDP